MEKVVITKELIDQLCTLVEHYRLQYDGDYIYLGDGEGDNNPQIAQREKVVPKIKRLYDKFHPYMENEDIKSLGLGYMMENAFEWALENLKTLWENEARFVWDDIQEDGRRKALGKQVAGKLHSETEREKKYFAKAIDVRLMEKKDYGYRWHHNDGMKASLGYFLNRVFNPKGTAQIPYQRMESLFNVSRLDTSISQTLNAKKPQKWRKEIDVLFDD